MNIALYLRVSTDRQSTDSQAVELRDYCARRGWSDTVEYSDTSSGAKFSRAGLETMMKDVRRHRIHTVVAFKLDRLGRSLPHLAQLIGEMTTHGTALVIPGQNIDTSASNPAGRLQMHVLMAVAEFEREIIRERVNAGLRAAKARGVRLGRPSSLEKHRGDVGRLLAQGMTVSAIGRELELPYSSTHKLARLCKTVA
jgi:DNA invertase Pin-like site-specific DNA recombinase